MKKINELKWKIKQIKINKKRAQKKNGKKQISRNTYI